MDDAADGVAEVEYKLRVFNEAWQEAREPQPGDSRPVTITRRQAELLAGLVMQLSEQRIPSRTGLEMSHFFGLLAASDEAAELGNQRRADEIRYEADFIWQSLEDVRPYPR